MPLVGGGIVALPMPGRVRTPRTRPGDPRHTRVMVGSAGRRNHQPRSEGTKIMTSTPGERRMQRAEYELRKEYGASVIKSWLIALAVIMAVPLLFGLYAWLVTH